APQKTATMASTRIRLVTTYSDVVGGPAARFIITNGVNGGMYDRNFASVPFGSLLIGIIAKSGSISMTVTGIMRLFASLTVLQTEPMPTSSAAKNRYPRVK